MVVIRSKGPLREGLILDNTKMERKRAENRCAKGGKRIYHKDAPNREKKGPQNRGAPGTFLD